MEFSKYIYIIIIIIITDIPDPLLPPFPIIHRLRQVFRITSRILT